MDTFHIIIPYSSSVFPWVSAGEDVKVRRSMPGPTRSASHAGSWSVNFMSSENRSPSFKHFFRA